MTHYTMDYSNMTPQQAYDKCISDIKDYLGEEKFEDISKQFRSEVPDMSIETFAFYLEICGVQGFPVLAWYDHVYPYG